MKARWLAGAGLVVSFGLIACGGEAQDPNAAGWSFAQPDVQQPRSGANVETTIDVLLAKQPTVANLDVVDPAKRFALRAEGGVVVADFIVSLDREHLKAGVAAIEALGGKVRTITNSGFITLSLPIDNVGDVAAVEGVGRIELGRRKQQYNDLSHLADGMNIPDAGTAAAPDGAGVIVGVIDSGLDFYHYDFRNPDGSTRVLALWDQADHDDYRPAAGFAYGTTYTQAELNDCLNGLGYCVQTDLDGHGTHVTGTAAGNGNATGQFAGAAPKADILFVKFDFDGDRNSDAAIIDGVNWIFQQAGDRPVVINMSLGSDFGPHDGSTLEERGIDDLIAPGKLVVAAAGNAGRTGEGDNVALWGTPMHGQGNFPRNACSNIEIEVAPGSSTAGSDYIFFDLWYSGAEKNRLQITTPSGKLYPPTFDKMNRTTFTTGSSISGFNTAEGAIIVGNGGDQFGWGSNNGDHEIYLEISDYYGKEVAAGTWKVCVYGTTVTTADNGEYHGWHGSSGSLAGARVKYQGIPTDNRMTVGAPAGASKVIAVGAYTTRMGWEYVNPITTTTGCQTYNVASLAYYDPFYLDLDDDGVYDHDFGGDCNYDPSLGDTSEPFHHLAFFSSRGPLRNGVLKPEISAPGVGIVSAMSSHALAAQVAAGGGYHINTNRVHVDGVHAVLQGTSMATPNATGAIALLLAAKPTLDHEGVRAVFAASARGDAATGPVPNDDWGHGKLDVTAALAELAPECAVDADCDDANACTTDTCVAGECVNDGAPHEGASCGGGAELCCAGACGTPACSDDAGCDDGDLCTVDSCSAPGTCAAACEYGTNEAEPACMCVAVGDSCSSNGDCCSGSCKGRPGKMVCK